MRQGAFGCGEPYLVARRCRRSSGCDGAEIIVLIQETVVIRIFGRHCAHIFENCAVYFYSFENVIDFLYSLPPQQEKALFLQLARHGV